MGQAKKRGTYEERVTQAKQRNQQQMEDAVVKRLEEESNSPKYKSRNHKANMELAMMLGVAGGLNSN